MVLCGVVLLSPPRCGGARPPLIDSTRPRRWSASSSRCCSPGKISPATTNAEDETRHVLTFKVGDFAVSDRVSIGLHGRPDELIFEATVSDPESSLYNSKVVLRQLTSSRARRRGMRALEVLKKLARRRLMYHSYATQVHGYVIPANSGEHEPFTLVHCYHGSYSLQHWLQLSDWLPTLEATLALDEECARRVGDENIGGPAVTRQLRLTRILMRDLLIGVNYLHSHGLAHTELRLNNVHISPTDRHVKVGILGNTVDFYDESMNNNTLDGNIDRRQLMIAFDMRCVGFIMAKMVLRELMDPSVFLKFKAFLNKGNDPSSLREFLLPILCRDASSGNAGLQVLDRHWGAGWHIISLLLASKPAERISCLEALRHPFLCGPRWRIDPSIDIIRWGLGSTTVRMTEDYIYVPHQRRRIAYFIELMELLNPNGRLKEWMQLVPGRWRLLYCTGRHIGLTFRQPSSRVLIDAAHITFVIPSDDDNSHPLSVNSDITFTVMPSSQWPHDKAGASGCLSIKSSACLIPGRRLYLGENTHSGSSGSQESAALKSYSTRWSDDDATKEPPFGVPAVKFVPSGELNVSMRLDSSGLGNVDAAKGALQEVRTQIPRGMFDVSVLVCGTYVDSRMLVLRAIDGSALLFTRSPEASVCT